MEPTFITDEIFITPGSSCKRHLKIKGTRNYYFKTIGYCSRTKVKSSLILRRFYATWPWALTLGWKCYYYGNFITLGSYLIYLCFLQTLPVQPWSLSEFKKKLKLKLKRFKYTSSHTKVVTFVWVYYDSPCQMLLIDLKTYPWSILYLQLLSRLSLIMLCLSKNLMPLLYITRISLKFLKTMGELKS